MDFKSLALKLADSGQGSCPGQGNRVGTTLLVTAEMKQPSASGCHTRGLFCCLLFPGTCLLNDDARKTGFRYQNPCCLPCLSIYSPGTLSAPVVGFFFVDFCHSSFHFGQAEANTSLGHHGAIASPGRQGDAQGILLSLLSNQPLCKLRSGSLTLCHRGFCL